MVLDLSWNRSEVRSIKRPHGYVLHSSCTKYLGCEVSDSVGPHGVLDDPKDLLAEGWPSEGPSHVRHP